MTAARVDQQLIALLAARSFVLDRPKLVIAWDPHEPRETRAEGTEDELEVRLGFAKVAPENEPVVRPRWTRTRDLFDESPVLRLTYVQVTDGE